MEAYLVPFDTRNSFSVGSGDSLVMYIVDSDDELDIQPDLIQGLFFQPST